MEADFKREHCTTIRLGLMNPVKPIHISLAITPVGTCMEKCPLREIMFRIFANMVSDYERVSVVAWVGEVRRADAKRRIRRRVSRITRGS